MGTARAMNSVRGMQAADGPDSSRLEWHQVGGDHAVHSMTG